MEKFVLEKIMTNITDIFHSVALTYMLTSAVYLSDQLILIFNKNGSCQVDHLYVINGQRSVIQKRFGRHLCRDCLRGDICLFVSATY